MDATGPHAALYLAQRQTTGVMSSQLHEDDEAVAKTDVVPRMVEGDAIIVTFNWIGFICFVTPVIVGVIYYSSRKNKDLDGQGSG